MLVQLFLVQKSRSGFLLATPSIVSSQGWILSGAIIGLVVTSSYSLPHMHIFLSAPHQSYLFLSFSFVYPLLRNSQFP